MLSKLINRFVAISAFALFGAAAIPGIAQSVPGIEQGVPEVAQSDVNSFDVCTPLNCKWPSFCNQQGFCQLPYGNGVRLHGVRVGGGSLHGAALRGVTVTSQSSIDGAEFAR